MSERSVTHDTFVLERTYDAPVARVFAAFADWEAKKLLVRRAAGAGAGTRRRWISASAGARSARAGRRAARCTP